MVISLFHFFFFFLHLPFVLLFSIPRILFLSCKLLLVTPIVQIKPVYYLNYTFKFILVVTDNDRGLTDET